MNGIHCTDIGVILKSQRESLGKSLNEASSTTKIRRYYLKAIEDGNVHAIPSLAYALWYVRDYANFLGLNGLKVANDFRQRLAVSEQELILPEPERVIRRPSKAILCASLFLTIGIYIAYDQWAGPSSIQQFAGFIADMDRRSKSHIDTDPLTASHHSVMSAHSNNDQGVYLQSDSNMNHAVLLAKDNAIIRIIDANGQVYDEKQLQAGDTYFIPEENGFTITSEQAEHIDVFTQGSLISLSSLQGKMYKTSANYHDNTINSAALHQE
jgi:cytoskeleton protein RodZ